jgi:hypothetical protein
MDANMLLMGKLERKGPLGKASLRWVDNVKMDFGEIGCGGMDWIDLVMDRDC